MQNVQDFFATTMDIALLCVWNTKRLSTPTNSADFCKKYTRGSALGREKCDECHRKLENAAKKKGSPVICKCHAGLENFAVPVFLEGQYTGSVIGGQVLTDPFDERHFRKLARKIGVNEDEYVAEAEKLKILSPEKFNAIAESLHHIAKSVASLAYANFLLLKVGIEYKIPRNIAIEEWVFMNCENIKSPLTEREFEVLKLIVLGKNNSEIAQELFVSIHTAKSHVSSILDKLLVEDRVQIAVKAVREGLV